MERRPHSSMTHRQVVVWQRLSTAHQGRAQGVRWVDLSTVLDIPDRALRETVATLVLRHGKPIGSHPRWGVYVCQDARDFFLARLCLHHEAVPTLRRLDALKRLERQTVIANAVRQGTLFDTLATLDACEAL